MLRLVQLALLSCFSTPSHCIPLFSSVRTLHPRSHFSISLPETNFVFEARHCSHRRRRHHHHHRVQISAAVFLLLSQTIVALQLPLARCLLPPQVKRHLPSDGLDVLLVCRIGRNNGAMGAIKREAARRGRAREQRTFPLSLLSCSTVAGCESNKVGRTNQHGGHEVPARRTPLGGAPLHLPSNL